MTDAPTHFILSRRFLSLFITQFLGAFNDNLFRQSLIMLITFRIAEQMMMQPAVLNNLAIGLFTLPFFLFSALAGQLADKFEKSGQIFWIKVWEIGLTLLGALGFYLESLPLLIGVLSGLGLQSTFFGPIKYGILPDLMKPNELLGANALVEAATFIAILLGTIVGGYVVLKDGGIASIAGLTVAVAVVGTLSGRLVPPTGRAAPDLVLTLNIFKATATQIRAAWSHRVARPAILGISWIWLFGSLYTTQIPDVVKNRIGADETVATLFLACFSLGIGAGSMLVSRLLKGTVSAHLAAPALIALCGFSLVFQLLMPTAPGPTLAGIDAFLSTGMGWAMALTLFAIAASAGVVIVPLYAILQNHTPRSERARMMAANNIFNCGYMAGGAIATAVFVSLGLSSTAVLLIAGAATLGLLPMVRRLSERL